MLDLIMMKLKINVLNAQKLYLTVHFALVVRHAQNAQIVNLPSLMESSLQILI